MNLKTIKNAGLGIMAAALLFSCNQDTNEAPQELETQLAAPSASNVIPGQFIIVFNNNAASESGRMAMSYEKSQDFVKAQTLKMLSEEGIKGSILNVYSKSISGATLKLNASDIEQLKKRKDVSYIEEDRLVVFAPPCGTPNGGPCDGGGGGGGTIQETPYGITRVNGVSSYTGSGVAWILDSGIDLDHEDLNVDASRGFNAFTSGRDGKSADDGNGHGTHVAGTIAALNNNVGVIGVAPGAIVIPVKVLDSRGSGSYSGVIAGVDHVGANGANGDVANMSLGGPVSQALDDAVVAASNNSGVKFALAAGNDSDDANNHSPARANGPNIVTISAMNSSDTWASFSNFGNPPVDFCAPGVAVKSTWKDGGYNTISGTSMASPHAAGVLLLGTATTNGTVNGDPDGNPDPIIVH